jgi:SAM-dependent methyltransferase
MKRKITKLLTRAILKVNLKGKKNDFYNQDVLFKNLQANTAPLPEYGYDKTTTWTRAAQRFINILKSFDSISLNEKCAFLDAGCGDGMLGILAESFGMKPYLVDMEDWRDERAKRLPLSIQRLEKLDKFDSNIFDLVSSFNTFEHLSDPKIAFEELIRVCKPGGFIFLEFGPIYHGPWGLHAYRSLHMPYPQFLFTEEFTLKKLADLGIYDLGKKK